MWYSVTIDEMSRLEQVWLNIMECSGSVPTEILYLRTRILMFFDHIMHQSKDYLLYRFFQAQARFPTHRDWTGQVLDDFEVIVLKIELN